MLQSKLHRLSITQKKRVPENVQVATSYNNLGVVHEKMGDFEKAKEYQELALSITQKSEDLRMYKRQLVTTTWVMFTNNWVTLRRPRSITNLL